MFNSKSSKTQMNKKLNISSNEIFEMVKKRAYEIYLTRNTKGKPGDHVSDWLAAEKEIRIEYNLR